MENIGTERLYAQYFKRRQAGGRTRLADILDAVLLRLILFAGAYLFFAAKLPENVLIALLLAGIFLALCLLVLRVCREVRLERFTRRELTRIRRLLMTDRLVLLDAPGIRALCGPLCQPGETPLLLQRMAPADGDAVLSALRSRRGKGKAGVFACGGFAPDAEELAARSGGMITLYPREKLLDAAAGAGLGPTAGEVRAYIAMELERMKVKRRFRLPEGLAAGRGRKYALVALTLAALSFFTRYALYYRLLAGLCMTVAGLQIFRMRTHPERVG